MNALNDLTTEVRFRERMRGYDFEEVDSYVKAVSRAVAQGRDQISELQQRLSHSESPSGSDDGVRETREMLLRTLVLAQRTADSAVAEARSEAKSISSSAQERAAKTVAEAESAANARLLSSEERAAQTLAEAEENCQLILAEAKRTAAAELATERARKVEEIQSLEATRAELEAATAAVQARLESERSQLRSLSNSLQSFIEQFEAVADPGKSGEGIAAPDGPAQDAGSGEALEIDAPEPVAELEGMPAPHTNGESALEFLPDADDSRPEPGDEAQEAAQSSSDEAQEAEQSSSDEAQEAEEDPSDEAQEAEHGEDILAVEESLADALATDRSMADTLPNLPAVGWHDEHDEAADGSSGSVHSTGSEDTSPARPELAEPHPGDQHETVAAPAMHARDATGPELFDVEAEDDDEFIEQLREVVSSDAPLPSADAAMAAFFDHDEGAGHRSGAAGRGGRLSPRA